MHDFVFGCTLEENEFLAELTLSLWDVIGSRDIVVVAEEE